MSVVVAVRLIVTNAQVFEWRVKKIEAFRLQQELAEVTRRDAEQARMMREEKEKMHREQQKAKVFSSVIITLFLLWYIMDVVTGPQLNGCALYVKEKFSCHIPH